MVLRARDVEKLRSHGRFAAGARFQFGRRYRWPDLGRHERRGFVLSPTRTVSPRVPGRGAVRHGDHNSGFGSRGQCVGGHARRGAEPAQGAVGFCVVPSGRRHGSAAHVPRGGGRGQSVGGRARARITGSVRRKRMVGRKPFWRRRYLTVDFDHARRSLCWGSDALQQCGRRPGDIANVRFPCAACGGRGVCGWPPRGRLFLRNDSHRVTTACRAA